MCGICGKYYFDPYRSVNGESIAKMTRALARRGPDDESIFVKQNVALGIRRLSIIDELRGKQPVCSEDKAVWCICNGEIYNYLEEKDVLSKRAHVFVGGSDCEILPHMYEEYGLSFVERIDGMFALAVFDFKNNLLMLARDRMGIKPLYYAQLPDSILFSSELRSMLIDGSIPREVSPEGLNYYFTYNYFPGEITPLKGIKKLPPGGMLICKDNTAAIKNYWQLNYDNSDHKPDEFYMGKFKSLFNESIKAHLRADVPVGIFLSGGLDSSSLSYYAAKFADNITTFSIGFKEKTYNECFYSDLAADYIGSKHFKVMIPEDLPQLLNKVTAALDVPTGEASFVPTFVLSEFARNYVKVVLSGEGADELFAGYQYYFADILAHHCAGIPRLIRQKFLTRCVGLIPVGYDRLNFRFKLELFLKGVNSEGRVPHYFWREVFSEADKKSLYNPEFLRRLEENNSFVGPYSLFEHYFNLANADNLLEKALFFDTKIWLPDGILHRVDMASMFHSLETRVPFLDKKMVEFAFALPLNRKINNFSGKYLLKKAFMDELPHKIVFRPKHGLSVPIGKWLRYELKDFAFAQFNTAAKQIDDLIDRKYAMTLFDEHVKGRRDNSRKLWNLLMFYLWAHNFAKERF